MSDGPGGSDGKRNKGRRHYSDKVWADVEAAWRTGQLTVGELSKRYGPDPTTISRHMRAKFPEESLSSRTKLETANRVYTAGVLPGDSPDVRDAKIVNAAAALAEKVVSKHRQDINDLRDLILLVMTDAMEASAETRAPLVKVAVDCMQKLQEMERKAWALDPRPGIDKNDHVSVSFNFSMGAPPKRAVIEHD